MYTRINSFSLKTCLQDLYMYLTTRTSINLRKCFALLGKCGHDFVGGSDSFGIKTFGKINRKSFEISRTGNIDTY